MFDGYPLPLTKQCWSPVKYYVADYIDKEIGYGNYPDVGIQKYLLTYKCLKLGRCILVFGLLFGKTFGNQCRQTNRLRGISHGKPHAHRTQQSDNGRYEKAPPPTQRDHIPAYNYNQPGPDGVRGIPYRHFGCQFSGRHPMGKHPGTGRESHSLKPAVQHPHDTEYQYRRTEAKHHVTNGG